MSPDRAAQITLVLYAALAVTLVVRQSGRCRYGRTVWWLYVLNRLYCGLFYRRRSNGRCPWPGSGPAIIIANHRSPLDPIVLWMNIHLGRDGGHELRPISFLMAREFYEVRGLQWAFRALRSVPVARTGRDMASAREALRHLADGDLVGIFPEGRINHRPDNVLLSADTGVAWLALRAEVPVYPAFIQGAPRSQSMITPFYTPARVHVIYGEAVDLSPYYDRKKSHETLREVTDLLMTRLAQLGGAVYHGTRSSENDQTPEVPPTLPMERATG